MEDLLVEFKKDLEGLTELQETFKESLKRAKVTKLPMIIDIAQRNYDGTCKAIEKLTNFIKEEEERL